MRTIITIGLIWLGVAALIAWWWHWRMAREKRLIGQLLRLSIDDLDAEDEPERDFMMERAKVEAQREDAEEYRTELARERRALK